MIKINEAIIVEGKYDKIKLSSFIDGLIITTDGFSIFKDKEKRELIRTLAQKRGILILTDSDGAGFVIRNHIKGFVPNERIKNAYIPEILGKEKRKTKPSKEGTLGVEGISKEEIIKALEKCGVFGEEKSEEEKITKIDLYEAGLYGRDDSVQKRDEIKKKLNLPSKLSANAFLDVLNFLMTKEEFLKIMKKDK